MDVIKVKKPIKQIEDRTHKLFIKKVYPKSKLTVSGPCEMILDFDNKDKQIKIIFKITHDTFIS